LIELTHPTIDQMHQLGLAGMARAFPFNSASSRRLVFLLICLLFLTIRGQTPP
jgi:hypothetical protein